MYTFSYLIQWEIQTELLFFLFDQFYLYYSLEVRITKYKAIKIEFSGWNNILNSEIRKFVGNNTVHKYSRKKNIHVKMENECMHLKRPNCFYKNNNHIK